MGSELGFWIQEEVGRVAKLLSYKRVILLYDELKVVANSRDSNDYT